MTGALGVIGLGIMGGAMAANSVKAGTRVVGYDIDAARRSAMAKAGVEIAGSVAELAKAAPVVITSLPSIAAFERVAEELAASGALGLVAVETSTLTLEAHQAAHDRLAQAGITLLDCPLSGTGAQAAKKDLVVFGSGDRGAFDNAAPYFAGFARSWPYLGAFGNGTRMKYIANLLVGIHNVASAEAMVLAQKAGLDLQQVYDVIRDSAGASRIFEIRGPQMVAGRYTPPTVSMEVWQKDLAVIGAFARQVDAPAPLFSMCAQLYVGAMAQGLAGQDSAAVCAVLERMAGIQRGSASPS